MHRLGPPKARAAADVPTSSNRIALFPGPSEVALCRAARRAGRDRGRRRIFGAGAPRPVRRACGAQRRGRGSRPYVPALALPEVPAAEPGHGVALPGTRGPRGPARPAGALPRGRTRHGGRTVRGLRCRHPADAVARSTPKRRPLPASDRWNFAARNLDRDACPATQMREDSEDVVGPRIAARARHPHQALGTISSLGRKYLETERRVHVGSQLGLAGVEIPLSTERRLPRRLSARDSGSAETARLLRDQERMIRPAILNRVVLIRTSAAVASQALRNVCEQLPAGGMAVSRRGPTRSRRSARSLLEVGGRFVRRRRGA